MESKISNTKRIAVARLDEGDDLYLSLEQLANEHGIRSGWFSAIGGLKEFAYGLYEQGGYRKIKKRAKHCFELLPTFGNISIKEGKVLIHAHVAATDEEEGAAFGGHLTEGSIIYPFAEVFMQECNAVLNRSYDKKTNLWALRFQT